MKSDMSLSDIGAQRGGERTREEFSDVAVVFALETVYKATDIAVRPRIKSEHRELGGIGGGTASAAA
mgnify:CR=1 FL=1